VDYLTPINQLFELNRELISSLENFESSITVVGGQALSYWINYYLSCEDVNSFDTGYDAEGVNSFDIDYAVKLKDARYLPKIWDVFDYREAKNSPPPSLAVIQLLKSKNEIKNKNGRLFIDMYAYLQDKELNANIVDLIDFPIGFTYNDFTDTKKTELYTECFEYPKEWQCPSHPKLRILNPISCLKSRLSNISAKIKEIQTEKERVKAIRVPIHAFLEQKFKTDGFRTARKYMDYFLDIIESNDGLKMETLHDVSLLIVVNNLKNNVLDKLNDIPEKYLNIELQNRINRIAKKIQKKLRVIS